MGNVACQKGVIAIVFKSEKARDYGQQLVAKMRLRPQRITGSDSRPLHFVMQLNDAVRKLLYTEQAERHLTMPRCKEGNAFPDEGWHDGDDELVNRVLVQERPDDRASAHHPHILAGLRAEAFGKGTDRLGDEADAGGHGSRRRPPREHIVHGICTEARAHLQTSVEGLAAEDLGIGGALEFGET
jgi:hypothetical protein